MAKKKTKQPNPQPIQTPPPSFLVAWINYYFQRVEVADGLDGVRLV
jgi:hypothetical protein